jgi:hypothetical protein
LEQHGSQQWPHRLHEFRIGDRARYSAGGGRSLLGSLCWSLRHLGGAAGRQQQVGGSGTVSSSQQVSSQLLSPLADGAPPSPRAASTACRRRHPTAPAHPPALCHSRITGSTGCRLKHAWQKLTRRPPMAVLLGVAGTRLACSCWCLGIRSRCFAVRWGPCVLPASHFAPRPMPFMQCCRPLVASSGGSWGLQQRAAQCWAAGSHRLCWPFAAGGGRGHPGPRRCAAVCRCEALLPGILRPQRLGGCSPSTTAHWCAMPLQLAMSTALLRLLPAHRCRQHQQQL